MAQALFANQRETNLASTLALVEEVLRELGHDPAASRCTDDSALHAWRIEKGPAAARVSLVARTEFTHLRVAAIVMTVDDKVDRPALHAQLLDRNLDLCGAAFATDRQHVLLVAERTTLDLDRSEIKDAILRVMTYADDFGEMLVGKLGGSIGSGGEA